MEKKHIVILVVAIVIVAAVLFFGSRKETAVPANTQPESTSTPQAVNMIIHKKGETAGTTNGIPNVTFAISSPKSGDIWQSGLRETISIASNNKFEIGVRNVLGFGLSCGAYNTALGAIAIDLRSAPSAFDFAVPADAPKNTPCQITASYQIEKADGSVTIHQTQSDEFTIK